MEPGNDTPSLGCSVSTVLGCDDLLSQIRERFGSLVRHLHLRAAEDGLILHGSTQSYYAKQLIQEAVMERTSIPIISNEIQVSKLPVA